MINRSVLGLVALAITAGGAEAAELTTPLFGGITIGIPAGEAAPPGVYLSTRTFYYKGSFVDGNGRNTGTDFRLGVVSPLLLLSTDYKILGGTYYAFAAQPLKHTDISSSNTTDSSHYGTFNTILSPINLSWDFGHGFYVSLGTTVYLPDGTYSLNGAKLANGFTSVEESLGVTYRKDGYALTAYTSFDFNGNNNTSNYRSGNLVGTDLTATKTIGNLTFGVGGYLINQYHNDVQNGLIVPSSSFNGVGNRYREYALGPYLGYNFKIVNVSAWYTQDVYARNTTKAGTGWLRFVVPLGNPFSATGRQKEDKLPAAGLH